MRVLDFNIDAFDMLSRTLTVCELGAFVRIGVHLATGRNIKIHRAHLVAGIDEQEWPKIFSALSEHMILDDNHETIISLAHGSNLISIQPPLVSIQTTAVKNKTSAPLIAESPSLVSNVRNAPAEVRTHDLRRNHSILKVAWDTAIRIYKESGKSEDSARQIIGQLLKYYKDGPVIHAINELSRRGDVAEPTSWMRAFLEYNYGNQSASRGQKGNKKKAGVEAPSVSAPPKRIARPIASAENLGISPERARKIQERNRLINRTNKDGEE